MNPIRVTIILLCLLVTPCAAIAQAPLSSISRSEVLTDVIFNPKSEIHEISSAMVHDENSSFIATNGGLYRLPASITRGDVAELVAFDGDRIVNLYMHEGALYVLKYGEEVRGSAVNHTFLRSVDGGETFTPLDAGLEACLGSFCGFMNSSEAAFHDGRIFINAGGNLIVSDDDGESWTALVGELTPAACYDPSFELIDNRVLIGGECPLDTAYIRAGELEDGELQWKREPEAVVTPELENRNIQFIRRIGDSSIVFSGIEGALLRSSDFGASFDFVLHFVDGESEKYPYIGHMLVSSHNPELMLIGGFDKRKLAPYLAYSIDGGMTWTDRSRLLEFDDLDFRELVFLHEESGRILAGVQNFEARVIRIVELSEGAARRRPARPRP